jgi:hypothetical protein
MHDYDIETYTTDRDIMLFNYLNQLNLSPVLEGTSRRNIKM